MTKESIGKGMRLATNGRNRPSAAQSGDRWQFTCEATSKTPFPSSGNGGDRWPDSSAYRYDGTWRQKFRALKAGPEGHLSLTIPPYDPQSKAMRRHKPTGPIRRILRRVARLLVRRKVELGWNWPGGNGLQPAGRPAPMTPRMPALSAAAAVPIPPIDAGPGIVYGIGHWVGPG